MESHQFAAARFPGAHPFVEGGIDWTGHKEVRTVDESGKGKSDYRVILGNDVFYGLWTDQQSFITRTLMVKVYYNYCFDRAIGFAASRNANFAVDSHSTSSVIKEK